MKFIIFLNSFILIVFLFLLIYLERLNSMYELIYLHHYFVFTCVLYIQLQIGNALVSLLVFSLRKTF